MVAPAALERTGSRRLTVAVAAAGICSFALLYAPQPLLPQLAAAFQLDAGRASLAVSVATIALAIAVLPIAVVSEVVGRRPVIVTSVLVSATLGLLVPLAPTFEVLLALRALQGIAIAGFPGVAAAYLMERLGRTGVAAAVGAMIAGNTVGGMSGRLATGLTTEPFGWRGALAVVGGLALLSALVMATTLPRHERSVPRGEARLAQRLRDAVRGLPVALRSRVLLGKYAVALLGMGSFVALYNAAGFRLTGEPLNLSATVASLVFLAYAVGAVSSATAGRLVARVGRPAALLAGIVTFGAGAVLTVPDSLPLVVAGFVVLTAGFFATHAVANGWAAAEAPAGARGPAGGLYTLSYYLGSSVGGTLGTVVYDVAGWGWLVVAVLGWLALAALTGLPWRRRAVHRPRE